MEATLKTTRQRARNRYTVLTLVSQHKYPAIQAKRCFFFLFNCLPYVVNKNEYNNNNNTLKFIQRHNSVDSEALNIQRYYERVERLTDVVDAGRLMRNNVVDDDDDNAVTRKLIININGIKYIYSFYRVSAY